MSTRELLKEIHTFLNSLGTGRKLNVSKAKELSTLISVHIENRTGATNDE
tara:strand:+ start:2163 stop:2312 length:150 start_codon:yes stop_codon:yes gene_type:complete